MVSGAWSYRPRLPMRRPPPPTSMARRRSFRPSTAYSPAPVRYSPPTKITRSLSLCRIGSSSCASWTRTSSDSGTTCPAALPSWMRSRSCGRSASRCGTSMRIDTTLRSSGRCTRPTVAPSNSTCSASAIWRVVTPDSAAFSSSTTTRCRRTGSVTESNTSAMPAVASNSARTLAAICRMCARSVPYTSASTLARLGGPGGSSKVRITLPGWRSDNACRRPRRSATMSSEVRARSLR